MNAVFDGTNWYGFVASLTTNHIFRYDFGNSLDNTPSAPVDIGNPGGTRRGY